MMASVRARYALAVAAGFAVLMAGCATAMKADPATARSPRPARPRRTVNTVNDVCPISGLEVDPHAPVALYQNVAVGFCGPRCVREWMMLTDKEKRRRIGTVTLNPRMRSWGRIPRDPFK